LHGQLVRDGETNAAGGAGDESDLVAEALL
jgi:hypothetical protein